MNELVIDGLLKEKTSSKGTQYQVIELHLTPTLTKDVFLDKAELEVLKLYYAINQKKDK